MRSVSMLDMRAASAWASGSANVELGAFGLPVEREGAARTDRVRALEDPVLPAREAAEDLGLHRLGPPVPQVGFEAGHRVRREARSLLEGDAHLVVPVDGIGRERDQAGVARGARVEG